VGASREDWPERRLARRATSKNHLSGNGVYQDLGHQFRVADNPNTAPPLPIEFGTPELVTSYGTRVTQELQSVGHASSSLP
jgi:hypothetical protein